MGFNFTFRTLADTREVRMLRAFLLTQALGYPDYAAWVERSMPEIESGDKMVVLAFSEGTLVGDLIYQPHKQFSGIREIKNLRIHPRVRDRHFASFMLRQAEVESPETFQALMCDVRPERTRVVSTLRSRGYEPLYDKPVPLYDNDNLDIVMVKRFQRTPEGLLAPIRDIVGFG